MKEEQEILLVEDNPGDVELTLHALRGSDFGRRVHVVGDGEAALDFLFCRGPYSGRSFEHPPKLVLLDLKLPKVDGLEVLRQIRTDPRTKTIPVVAFTSSQAEGDVIEGYRLGINSYIYKPTDFDEFREMVKQAAQYWLQINQPPPLAAFRGQ